MLVHRYTLNLYITPQGTLKSKHIEVKSTQTTNGTHATEVVRSSTSAFKLYDVTTEDKYLKIKGVKICVKAIWTCQRKSGKNDMQRGHNENY